MLSSIARFWRDEEGATAIEYGIIAGLMAIILIGIFSETTGIGKALIDMFAYIGGKLPTKD
ncbi:pilus assembly protein Flp/PilA [Variovorax sp. OK605]|jgi:pilus assembly protein Flp/PilA|uniref:Flp family type IVb pilin n=1 Tax=unclassified Variovorax TaxID=663243 RepID=UPI0008D056D7|nr:MULTISPECIES: Flp family type IVb pilin [unclassified Variovorax]SEK11076.1 pilus assembly protein Flp/PilA [Variovorax sp. OK202]SFD72320.1 pilus assembly protein Flp/PilA [Variovorax sp. OK212]SFP95128.1 pilus assembly protein Flp/PilA [Variovorax sp. OK605]